MEVLITAAGAENVHRCFMLFLMNRVTTEYSIWERSLEEDKCKERSNETSQMKCDQGRLYYEKTHTGRGYL